MTRIANRRACDSKRPRPAYTLMELLLVMAIIVALAAVATPSFRGVMRNISLKSGASEVRAEMTKAHVLAMKTGRTQVFQYELGGSKFKIEPWIDGSEAIEGQGGDTAPTPAQPQPAGADPDLLPGENKLPEGTKFTLGDSAMESRTQRIEQQLGSTGGANWSRPILFFPDGSSVDAFLVIGNEFDAGIRVDLRGITAAVRVSDVMSLQQLEHSQSPPP